MRRLARRAGKWYEAVRPEAQLARVPGIVLGAAVLLFCGCAMAGVLKEFGAVDAIAFDGGGSATMAMADGMNGEPRVLNRPSDGKERAVGNNQGVIIRDRTGEENMGKTHGMEDRR